MSPRRLDELFDAAQEVAPEGREAWLDRVCIDDAELRRRLQRLLDADARVDGILESGRPLIREALSEEAQAPSSFGVWRVPGPLGAGGMGAVWLERAAGAALAAARKLLPKGNYKLGASLFALARAKLALRKGSEAEALLREALAVRSPPFPAGDPRVLDVKVTLIRALEIQDKAAEAAPLRDSVTPLLAASDSPYLAGLRRRITPD